jgi:hypothetical protein
MKKPTARQIVFMFAGVLALAALSCSGAADVTNLFATDTPTPTNTFTPSPTMTPSPTSTSTLTPSPSPTPAPTGSKTEEQADGSTLFTDYDNQYQLMLPEGWIILPLSSQDMAEILQSVAKENPELQNVADSFKNLDPNVIRVMAFNKDPKYNTKGFTTNMVVTAIDNKVLSSMPMDFVTGALEESIKQQGGELMSADNTIITNANGVEMGSFEFKQTTPTAAGTKVTVLIKAIAFRAAGKLIMVQVATPEKFGKEVLPVLDQLQDSVKLTE